MDFLNIMPKGIPSNAMEHDKALGQLKHNADGHAKQRQAPRLFKHNAKEHTKSRGLSRAMQKRYAKPWGLLRTMLRSMPSKTKEHAKSNIFVSTMPSKGKG